MSQSDDRSNQSKSPPWRGELKPIEIDETIVAGIEKHETNFDLFLESMPIFQFVKQLGSLNDRELEAFDLE